jgi:beta-fructofuranosidase
MSPKTLEPDTLTAFYTSISHLPLHHSLPYKYGSEALHMATSIDSGRTWCRFPGNPVLPGPPADLDVTGWRDPYVAPWPSLSAELSQPTDTLYGIISGGIRGRGPTAFLYQLDRGWIGVWRFLSVLVPLPAHLTLDFGKNWECANFISLSGPDTSDVHDFLVFGAEGRLPNDLSRDQTEFRVDHAQMWICGKLRRGDGQVVTMDYQYGGRFDYGAYYAGNSFWDPKVKRQVILGWIVEEDLPLDLTRRQGWAGMLSFPRVLSVQSLRSVVGTVSGRSLDSITSVGLKRENDGAIVVASGDTIAAYTVTTLCATPDERIANLRSGPRVLSPADFERGSELSLPHGPTAWEMDMAFDMGASVGRVGLVIEHHPPGMFPSAACCLLKTGQFHSTNDHVSQTQTPTNDHEQPSSSTDRPRRSPSSAARARLWQG